VKTTGFAAFTTIYWNAAEVGWHEWNPLPGESVRFSAFHSFRKTLSSQTVRMGTFRVTGIPLKEMESLYQTAHLVNVMGNSVML
jgi:hypothetical protein